MKIRPAESPNIEPQVDRPTWYARLTFGFPALLSLCIHLTSLLALVVWLSPAAVEPKASQDFKPGDIVLARVSSPERVDYLDEATNAASQTGQADSGSAASESNTSAALPGVQSSALPVELPSASGLEGVAQNLLPGLQGGAVVGKGLPSGLNEAAILAEDAGRRGSNPAPIGTPGGLTLFGSPGRGRSFVMVLDRSASMGDAGLGAIRSAAEELSRQLASLNEQQRVQVVAYHAATSQLSEHWLPATDPNKKKLVDYLRSLPAFGSTNHTAALITALKMKPEVIFLLTDGGDPGMDGNQLRIVRGLAKGKTTIHAIQFGRGDEAAPAEHFMRKLAADTGGSYAYVNVNRLP